MPRGDTTQMRVKMDNLSSAHYERKAVSFLLFFRTTAFRVCTKMFTVILVEMAIEVNSFDSARLIMLFGLKTAGKSVVRNNLETYVL